MHLIKVCQGGSCRRNFAEDSLKRAEKVLEIRAGETSSDGRFKLETCGCLSGCDFGPNVFFGEVNSPLSGLLNGGTVENRMFPDRLENKIKTLKDSAL